MSIGFVALSGLQAASKRLEVSASNTANVSSTAGRDASGALKNEPYRALRVEQASLVPAGVRARVSEDPNATITVFDPSSLVANEEGLVEAPNVSLDQEIIQQNIAGYDFKANLKVLQAQDENFKALLDIQA